MTGGSVTGVVLHPDTRHRAQVQHTTLVTERELARGIAYARLHTTERYNLYTYDCITFARGMYQAVTGRAAPLAGILIDDPSDLAQSIRHERDAQSEFPPTLR
ncbi:hypothetical protein [Amycolatopsis sp. lyj-346]|uniref:hypothetical protein n=1 Tax=Amycolatopsis sp. lyj-346 TaxID=2789289 RepID=UPI003978579C